MPADDGLAILGEDASADLAMRCKSHVQAEAAAAVEGDDFAETRAWSGTIAGGNEPLFVGTDHLLASLDVRNGEASGRIGAVAVAGESGTDGLQRDECAFDGRAFELIGDDAGDGGRGGSVLRP